MASPFKKKSPLNAYKYSLTSQYANPKGVIQPIVEAEAAKAIGDASKKVLGVYSKIEADKKAKTASDEAGDLKHQRAMEVKWGKGNTGPAVKPASHEENMSNFGLTSFKDVQAERDAKDFMNRDFGGNKDSNSLVDIGRAGRTSNSSQGSNKNTVPQTFKGGIKTGKNVGYIPYHRTEKGSNGERRSMAMMKGSPVKHNAETALADARQNNPFARMLKSNNVPQNLDAAKSQPRNFAGVIAQAISDQGGSAAGSIGQQIGNQAQQRAADAGGSTGVDSFLPPPNQVAETGSYGGGGDRILEMDSNPVGNQSIGRDTDITSQLFGSGQRASMLAMKGTPLHHDSEKQAHTHPTKTTTKISGKGEMPGSSYVKDDYVDEDDLQDVGLQRHTATLVQSDNKGTFIKQKSDTGSESNISTAKGYGAKIRLNNMSRPDYTSNESSQSDPHNFLFQNTPKNNIKQ